MKTERDYPRFTVTRKGCAWAAQGHPWIYAQEIMSKSAEPENGSLADAVGENGRSIGTGLPSSTSLATILSARSSRCARRRSQKASSAAFSGSTP